MVSFAHCDSLSWMKFTNPIYEITPSSATCRYGLEDGYCTCAALVEAGMKYLPISSMKLIKEAQVLSSRLVSWFSLHDSSTCVWALCGPLSCYSNSKIKSLFIANPVTIPPLQQVFAQHAENPSLVIKGQKHETKAASKQLKLQSVKFTRDTHFLICTRVWCIYFVGYKTGQLLSVEMNRNWEMSPFK